MSDKPDTQSEIDHTRNRTVEMATGCAVAAVLALEFVVVSLGLSLSCFASGLGGYGCSPGGIFGLVAEIAPFVSLIGLISRSYPARWTAFVAQMAEAGSMIGIQAAPLAVVPVALILFSRRMRPWNWKFAMDSAK